jgi:hypothetical protein
MMAKLRTAFRDGGRETISGEYIHIFKAETSPHPSIKSKLPMLKATANLRGRTAMRGMVRKATKKQTAAPAQHSKKPRKRSQRERAK